jgi:hypothetical protein
LPWNISISRDISGRMMIIVRRFLTILSLDLMLMMICSPSFGSAADTLSEKKDQTRQFHSLAFPGEIYVITSEQLNTYNINTFDDILELLPGVNSWVEGPPASRSGFSLDGRSCDGVTLYVNGYPFCNLQSNQPLSRFIPLSRLSRVEVIYTGTPLITGEVSSNGAINVVIEEGGREAPFAEMDFTYGRSNRRARRIWFSTPRSYISGTVAYDAYLQDAFVPSREVGRIGNYHSKSVLADILVTTDEGEELLFRLQRYEDVYAGTYYSAGEEVRHDGFSSRLQYRRGNFGIGLFQDELNMINSSGELSGLKISARADYLGSVGDMDVKVYMSVTGTSLESSLKKVFTDTIYTVISGETLYVRYKDRERNVPVEPEDIHKIEGGVSAGAGIGRGVRWRAGLFGGDHNVTGRYWEGEGGLVRVGENGLRQSLIVAQRMRLPSPTELFYPVADSTFTGNYLETGGNRKLDPEVSQELTLGLGYGSSVAIDVFARRKNSEIVNPGNSQIFINSEESQSVIGCRGRLNSWGEFWRFRWGWQGFFQFFPYGRENVCGIPHYRLRSEASVKTDVFKNTEVLKLWWRVNLTGQRNWCDTKLDPFVLHDLGLSMTILGATVRGEYRNILDEEYETVPGFIMPGRYWMIGIYWEFFD